MDLAPGESFQAVAVRGGWQTARVEESVENPETPRQLTFRGRNIREKKAAQRIPEVCRRFLLNTGQYTSVGKRAREDAVGKTWRHPDAGIVLVPTSQGKAGLRTVGGLLDPESYSRYNGTDVETTLPKCRGMPRCTGSPEETPAGSRAGGEGGHGPGLSVELTGEQG